MGSLKEAKHSNLSLCGRDLSISTSNFSFNNGNIDFINLETIYGRTDRSRTENWPVCLGEEAPSGEDLEYLDEIERERNYELNARFAAIQIAQFNYPVITSF